MTIAQMKSSIHDPDCDKDLQNYRDQIDQLTSKFDQTLDEFHSVCSTFTNEMGNRIDET